MKLLDLVLHAPSRGTILRGIYKYHFGVLFYHFMKQFLKKMKNNLQNK